MRQIYKKRVEERAKIKKYVAQCDMRLFFPVSNILSFFLNVDKLPSVVSLAVEIGGIFGCLFLLAEETEALLAVSLFAIFVAHGNTSCLGRAGRNRWHGHCPTETPLGSRRTVAR